MNVGNKVKKVGGDYQFEGTVVAAFKKLSGVERFVVEDDRGVLHVYSEKNLQLLPDLKIPKFFIDFRHRSILPAWRKFRVPFTCRPKNQGHYYDLEGKESFISVMALTDQLEIDDKKAFVKAAVWEHHQYFPNKSVKACMEACTPYVRFAEALQARDVIYHYEYGGILSSRSGLVILRPDGDTFRIVEHIGLTMS